MRAINLERNCSWTCREEDASVLLLRRRRLQNTSI